MRIEAADRRGARGVKEFARLLLVVVALLFGRSQSGLAQASPGETAKDTLPWNDFDFGWTTLHLGYGLVVDYGAFGQDDASKRQISTNSGAVFRDGRLLVRGRFRGRGVTWQTGLMYDEPSHSWRFRQTGFMLPLNEPWGRIFLGRTKEGTSLEKQQVGYFLWNIERYPFSDAVVPILGDGIRWFGYLPSLHLIWNVGAFGDWLDNVEAYSKEEYHYATRLAWVSDPADSATSLLHVGFSARYSQPDQDSLRYKSRPQSFRAPNYVDTGTFPATQTWLLGPELYYRSGAFLGGIEYLFLKADSPDTGNPLFHGGEAFVSWLFKAPHRSYSRFGGVFLNVIPTKSVWEGGWGAFETVFAFSYTDLTDGTLEGGVFWRITPTVTWYLSRYARFQVAYGYGQLERFDLVGATDFLQARVNLLR